MKPVKHFHKSQTGLFKIRPFSMISHAKQTQNILFQKEYVQKYIDIKNTNLLVQGWKKKCSKESFIYDKASKIFKTKLLALICNKTEWS